MGLTLGWKAPCSELKGPECGSSGGMPGMVGGQEGKNWETQNKIKQRYKQDSSICTHRSMATTLQTATLKYVRYLICQMQLANRNQNDNEETHI